MAQSSHIILGGGLSGGLAALALADAGRGAGVVVVEAGDTLGGNHTWSCHETDLDEAGRAIVTPLIAHRWPRHVVRFPGRERRLEGGYLTVTSERFERLVRERLARAGATVLTGARAVEVGARGVRLADGRALEADVVLDARGPELAPRVAGGGFQKFVGVEVALEDDGPWDAPVVMDASVEQIDGFRFVYVLPFSRRHVLVEDTVYSEHGRLDADELERRAVAYAEQHGARVARVLRREVGVLPLPAERPREVGSPVAGPRPLAIGYRGGFFHGVTGYSLPEAARVAQAIARGATPQETAAALDALVRERGRQRSLERLLARLMFGAMPPSTRWTALERFYRLPSATIARFYASRTTAVDRARLLLGRPPAGLSWRRLLAGAREAA
ncbi:MAG TPA: lycopene beta-cyclase CrtY [Polyangia bacterium]|nr:lycopene beta-cyclase CrtY [Polyangia bacterium]